MAIVSQCLYQSRQHSSVVTRDASRIYVAAPRSLSTHTIPAPFMLCWVRHTPHGRGTPLTELATLAVGEWARLDQPIIIKNAPLSEWDAWPQLQKSAGEWLERFFSAARQNTETGEFMFRPKVNAFCRLSFVVENSPFFLSKLVTGTFWFNGQPAPAHARACRTCYRLATHLCSIISRRPCRPSGEKNTI